MCTRLIIRHSQGFDQGFLRVAQQYGTVVIRSPQNNEILNFIFYSFFMLILCVL
jgi:hypothetical protein